MSMIESFIPLWENEFQLTLNVLRAIPENNLEFKPHEKFFTVRRLAWHLVRIEDLFGRGILGDKIVIGNSKLPGEPPATIAEMIAVAEKQHPEIVNNWRGLDDETLRQKIPFVSPDGVVRRELRRMLYLHVPLMHHVIHHRGQLTLMLRLMGAKVPSLYGPSGDEGWPVK
jgi:uncharacterized damage-inducible protein DinB